MMNIATHIQWRKFSWKGEGGEIFANFQQICFDFAYYFILILYLSDCLIRCVCKKSFLSFSYFSMVIEKNMQNQNKFVGNSQSFASLSLQLNFRHCICVAIFIILESQRKSYGINTTSYAHKTTSYAHKLQVTRSKLTSLNARLTVACKWL